MDKEQETPIWETTLACESLNSVNPFHHSNDAGGHFPASTKLQGVYQAGQSPVSTTAGPHHPKHLLTKCSLMATIRPW